ncbi:hypothetical protein AB0I81_22720 [Nonomuraea sp. NPDC050404]|uniref:hypothetical protein n=1 Tax=Nonomuraea sp. NPDC050404 TaxID=3155783 RepID=UPI0033CE7359
MSIQTATRYTVTCDGKDCAAEHHDPASDSNMSARIAAGVAGWKHASSYPNRAGRRSYDYCPNCEVPK